jgi:hypothetical protein
MAMYGDSPEFGESEEPRQPPPGTINQQIQHSPVSARIPPHIGRGVFSTGAIVFDGQNEFVLDFVARLGAPHTVVARVVLPHLVFGQFILALRENLGMYEGRFGKPPALPTPQQMQGQPGQGGQPGQPGGQQPQGSQAQTIDNQTTITDLYEQLKLPDELMSGVYANAVMIGHTPSEFWFDFITNFYPRSAVSARVILTAQQIPSILDTMTVSYQRKQTAPGSPLPPLPPPGQKKPDDDA